MKELKKPIKLLDYLMEMVPNNLCFILKKRLISSKPILQIHPLFKWGKKNLSNQIMVK